MGTFAAAALAPVIATMTGLETLDLRATGIIDDGRLQLASCTGAILYADEFPTGRTRLQQVWFETHREASSDSDGW
jgi:hypothetical protein